MVDVGGMEVGAIVLGGEDGRVFVVVVSSFEGVGEGVIMVSMAPTIEAESCGVDVATAVVNGRLCRTLSRDVGRRALGGVMGDSVDDGAGRRSSGSCGAMGSVSDGEAASGVGISSLVDSKVDGAEASGVLAMIVRQEFGFVKGWVSGTFGGDIDPILGIFSNTPGGMAHGAAEIGSKMPSEAPPSLAVSSERGSTGIGSFAEISMGPDKGTTGSIFDTCCSIFS